MGRYCIVCRKLFGCIKGDEKHVCSDCRFVVNCIVRYNFTRELITGGICNSCWENRDALKKAMNH